MSPELGEDGPGTVGRQEADLHAWAILRPLLDAGPYLPWSDGAMRPAGLVDVCNEVVLAGRRRVVELGAGASTLLLGRLLRERGGHLDAVEHHGGWAAWVTAELDREGLAGHARVTHAPLAPSPLAADALPWYAAEPLARATAGDPIDLLVVDGPPAHVPGAGLARLPALVALADGLAPDAVVVLDDVARPGEQAVLDRWEATTAWRFERRGSGIAVGRRAQRE